MRAQDFDFHLPPELIAQQAKKRGFSRLLVMQKSSGQIVHQSFQKIIKWLNPGDCLVINDSRVFPARLWLKKEDTQASIELLLHREISPGIWQALSRPYRRLHVGTILLIGSKRVRIRALCGAGKVEVDFGSAEVGWRLIKRWGITPLPPYIRRDYHSPNSTEHRDRQRYQTCFAAHVGSVAAPTAGLHFSPAMIRRLIQKGIQFVPITLHVGWGTFSPLPEGPLQGKRLHVERFTITADAARRLNHCREHQTGRIIACGTTAARALEAGSDDSGRIYAQTAETDIFIYPGYTWKMVQGLLTNFHLPQSSLLMLVSAFAGRKNVLNAYHEAVLQQYRFFSFGDAMLII